MHTGKEGVKFNLVKLPLVQGFSIGTILTKQCTSNAVGIHLYYGKGTQNVGL